MADMCYRKHFIKLLKLHFNIITLPQLWFWVTSVAFGVIKWLKEKKYIYIYIYIYAGVLSATHRLVEVWAWQHNTD